MEKGAPAPLEARRREVRAADGHPGKECRLGGSEEQPDDPAVAEPAEKRPLKPQLPDKSGKRFGKTDIVKFSRSLAPPVPWGIDRVNGEELRQAGDQPVENRVVFPVAVNQDEGRALSSLFIIKIDAAV